MGLFLPHICSQAGDQGETKWPQAMWDAHCGPQQGTSQLGRRESHAAALQMFPSRWAGMGNQLIKPPWNGFSFLKHTRQLQRGAEAAQLLPHLPVLCRFCPSPGSDLQWTNGPRCTPPGPQAQTPDGSATVGKDEC